MIYFSDSVTTYAFATIQSTYLSLSFPGIVDLDTKNLTYKTHILQTPQ